MNDSIIIKGARVNNLKNIDLEIPRGKFVVVTGISGSGKSSLAFDTLYAEGQRRFAESISSYARQFLGRMSKPDVDLIDGIPPAIAIEQKVNIKNPRSTVATTTEIYDFLRLIFARIGRTYSPVSGREVHRDGPADVMRWLEKTTPGTLYILADLHWGQRKDKVELMLGLKEDGYSRLYLPGNGKETGEVRQIDDILQLDGNWPEDAWLLIDRLKVADPADYLNDKDLRTRLLGSISDAFSRGNGDIRMVAAGIPSQDLCHPRLRGGTMSEANGGVERSETSEGGIPAMTTKNVTVTAFPLNHKMDCYGYRFDEIVTPRRNPWKPRSYAYVSDTAPFPELASYVKDVDLLYHEATYPAGMEDKAQQYYHSTSLQAARCARDAGARQLIIGHYSSRIKDISSLAEECRDIFPESFTVNDGDIFEIPYIREYEKMSSDSTGVDGCADGSI